jgi:hypothetical protein
MKQQKSRRTAGRWSERTVPAKKSALRYTDDSPSPQEQRMLERITGQGPYESSYDISRGYTQDRSIVLP